MTTPKVHVKVNIALMSEGDVSGNYDISLHVGGTTAIGTVEELLRLSDSLKGHVDATFRHLSIEKVGT